MNLIGSVQLQEEDSDTETSGNQDKEDDEDDGSISQEEYEVEKLLDVCYGDPNEVKKVGLYFKVCQLLMII